MSLILRFMGRPKLGRSGVNDADYHVPFRFTGTINKLTVKPGPEQFTEDPPIRAPTVYPGPAKAVSCFFLTTSGELDRHSDCDEASLI